MGNWSVRPVDPFGDTASALVRAYLHDIVSRYHGRPATEAEVDLAIADDPTDDLTGFLAAEVAGEPVGCAAFRMVTEDTVELKRVHVLREHRGQGLGRALVEAVERAARDLGARQARLDTRSDLIEARAMYAALGYREVEPFNDDPCAHHWFGKRL